MCVEMQNKCINREIKFTRSFQNFQNQCLLKSAVVSISLCNYNVQLHYMKQGQANLSNSQSAFTVQS